MIQSGLDLTENRGSRPLLGSGVKSSGTVPRFNCLKNLRQFDKTAEIDRGMKNAPLPLGQLILRQVFLSP